MAINARERRRNFEIMRGELLKERQTFISHWRDIGDYILPRRPTFNLTDTNKGDRRNLKIIDSTATLSSRTLASGMVSHVTSPARQWFKLSVADARMRDIGAVKDWLHTVTKRMSAVFLQSNIYNSLPTLYGDMSVFGTGAMLVEEDFDHVIRTYVFPIGSYMIAANDKGLIDVFMREFRLTVRQLVQKFGERDENGNLKWDNFSTQVKNLYDRGLHDTWIDILHVIQPNKNYNPKILTSKKYESVYYERGISGHSSNLNTQETDVYLRDRGYDYFPVLVVRWETTGEDVYGTWCPGMAALGDVKALQTMQKRKAQAIEKMINPAMVAPSMMKTLRTSILPGDITYVDEREGMKGFRPAHEVNVRIAELSQDILDHQKRIQRAFYENLFLMLAMTDRREITATEVNERKEEKLIALGPVLEQLNLELLDPLIDITFNIMLKQDMIPEPPPELSGQKLKVEYISILHQAQKLTGLVGIEKLIRFAGEVAQYDPSVLDKIDRDQAIDEVADITGVPPRIVVPDEVVAKIRQTRAQQQAAAQQVAMMQGVAGAAKDLGKADMNKDTALTALLQQGAQGA
jgi:rRNA-processing protein FCF1